MYSTIINLLVAIGISLSNSTPENVPTSLCHDPLLGLSMIIHNSDCDIPVQGQKDTQDQTIVINEVVKESPVIVPVDDTEDNSNNVPDMPLDDTESDSKHNNGNHYGNDKPDNNPKDNSKFNGADSREDFEKIKDDGKK